MIGVPRILLHVFSPITIPIPAPAKVVKLRITVIFAHLLAVDFPGPREVRKPSGGERGVFGPLLLPGATDVESDPSDVSRSRFGPVGPIRLFGLGVGRGLLRRNSGGSFSLFDG